LKLLYGSNVISQSSAAYNSYTSSYWSLQQTEPDPYCIFQPTSQTDVSVVILISRLTQCPFAVRSGGHAAFKGASNIDGGITVSLAKLKGAYFKEPVPSKASVSRLWFFPDTCSC
jgi:FAD/FMN-containing dehydrogenase